MPKWLTTIFFWLEHLLFAAKYENFSFIYFCLSPRYTQNAMKWVKWHHITYPSYHLWLGTFIRKRLPCHTNLHFWYCCPSFFIPDFLILMLSFPSWKFSLTFIGRSISNKFFQISSAEKKFLFIFHSWRMHLLRYTVHSLQNMFLFTWHDIMPLPSSSIASE